MTITNTAYKLLVDTLKVQTNGENEKLMVLFLDKELRKLKLKYMIDSAGNILVVKGVANTYPCVVSHMDTVHKFVTDFRICIDAKNNDELFAKSGDKQTGIGGDDKCGVFACLQLLKIIPEIKVVFFSREESGCQGSNKINHNFFSDCRYIIQLDRRGKEDFIQTYWGKKTINHRFSSEIGFVKQKYGYKNAMGTVTDCMKLWDAKVGISCINLSCGYYQAHSSLEYISVSELWNSIKFTEEIISTLKPRRYECLPPKPTYTTTTSNITKIDYTTKGKCDGCNKEIQEYWLWDIGEQKLCWSCKTKEDKSNNTNDIDNYYACCTCGKKFMRGSGLLIWKNNKFYCSTCIKTLSDDNLLYIYYCSACKELLKEDETTFESDHANDRLCRTCNTEVQLYSDVIEAHCNIRTCGYCQKLIESHELKTTYRNRPICNSCSEIWVNKTINKSKNKSEENSNEQTKI